MTKGNPTIVNFVKAKETPGTYVYQEVDAAGQPRKATDGGVIGSLYIRKTALNGSVPNRLQVSIVAQ